jgi:hypothetical protein
MGPTGMHCLLSVHSINGLNMFEQAYCSSPGSTVYAAIGTCHAEINTII